MRQGSERARKRAILLFMPPEDESSLDKLEKRLYSARPDALQPARPLGAPAPHTIPHAWENVPEPAPMAPRKRKKRSIPMMFFIGSILFFVAAGAIALYLLISGGRSVSTDNINLSTEGSPTTIAAGDTVPVSLSIENRNPVELEDADLSLTFPEGTRSADDVTQAYPRYDEHFDSIASGARLERTIRAVVFGEEGQVVSIPVTLTYHTAGSNAVFVKQGTYQFTISTAPITLTVSSLSESVSGQPLTLDVTVRSNATAPIQGALVQAEYPFGFTVTNTSVPGDNGLFALGTLAPGDTKDIKITGTLSGEDGGTRVFRFTAGTANAAGGLSVTYTSKQASVALTAPFLDVSVSIDGADADGAVVSPGATVRANISWKNTLPSAVNDAQVKVALSGAVDKGSVTADNGFYQSSDESILFDTDTDPSLASLAPGAAGVGSFTFKVPSNAGGSSNASSIGIVVSIAGNRTNESNVVEKVSASEAKTVKVAGNLTISTATEHALGPFPNSGPVPPAAGQATTYTVVWKANAGSAVAGAKAVATLPSYVKFTNNVAPVGSVTYDDSTRRVTWNIGDLSAGSAPTAAFQVSVLPSTSQSGSAPTLVSAPTLTGYDRFAATNITFTGAAATTETPGDPGYIPGSGQVR